MRKKAEFSSGVGIDANFARPSIPEPVCAGLVIESLFKSTIPFICFHIARSLDISRPEFPSRSWCAPKATFLNDRLSFSRSFESDCQRTTRQNDCAARNPSPLQCEKSGFANVVTEYFSHIIINGHSCSVSVHKLRHYRGCLLACCRHGESHPSRASQVCRAHRLVSRACNKFVCLETGEFCLWGLGFGVYGAVESFQ